MATSSKVIAVCALASGSALLAIAGIWWYKRRRRIAEQNRIKPLLAENFTKVVGSVDKLWVYPLKSAYRVEVDQIECDIRGFKHDRCWTIADDQMRLVSQKKAPKLATVVPKIEEEDDGSYTLVLNAPDHEELRVPQPATTVLYTSLSLFTITGMGQDVGDEAADWIAKCTGLTNCRMYYMARSSVPRKPSDHPRYGDLCSPGDQTSFANFSPVFIISSSSLEELNTRTQSPIPMTRFRPNIVVSGCEKHKEDSWNAIRIGETCILKLINPGPRCPVTTIDQELGKPPVNNEPLDTLNTYRRYEQVYGESNSRYTTGPLFGANFSVVTSGTVKLGDPIYIRVIDEND